MSSGAIRREERRGEGKIREDKNLFLYSYPRDI
jgi:hypothetical protein